MPFSTPSVLRFFNFISFKRESGAKRAFFMRIDEPHRGSAFDSPGLASIASYPGLICCVGYNAIGVALFKISSFQKGGGTQAEPFCRIPTCVRTLTQSHTSEKAHIGVG